MPIADYKGVRGSNAGDDFHELWVMQQALGLLTLRLKVQPVDLGQQTSRRVQLAIDKGRIEEQLGPLIGDLRLPPVFDLALHGLEVPLDSVHSDSKECQSD
jgi:hypothetical protein